MNDRMLAKISAFAIALGIGLGVATNAAAITNGVADGDAHPSVGVLVAEVGGAKAPICSGTLVAPTVFVTAGHCTAWLPSAGITRVWVSFDSTLDPERWALVGGAYRTDPAFGHDLADLHDLAVVLLDHAPAGVTPAALPAAGALDGLGRGGARGDSLTSVGYGFYDRTTGSGPPQFLYDGVRRSSTSPVASLTETWVRLLASSSATGGGGTCFGDSGGPQFLGASNVVVAVTSRGDSACAGIGWSSRLDTASARGFLGQFVPLP